MFTDYRPSKGYDEYFSASEEPRRALQPLLSSLGALGLEQLNHNHAAAGMLLKRLGATFRLNDSGSRGGERILPFDPLPRLIGASEWDLLQRGLIQRLEAIDLFLADVYGDQAILRDGYIPREDVETSQGWRPQLRGFRPPLGKWCQISGLDLIRDGVGTWRVLEDNLRCPSGVAYFLENRRVMKRMFPSLFSGRTVQPIDSYPSQLLQTLRDLAPWTEAPRVVLLTPGAYNSAYFEHTYLAREMGIEIVEGRDLVVRNARVYMRTTKGLQPVHVIYRRVDDDFIDPTVFRRDSMLGVPGLVHAYRSGNVSLANSIGTGIAADKVMYYFVPKQAGRPIYSYRLSIVHFWSLISIYMWAGPHHLHYTTLPDWAQSIGMVFSLMLLAPSWGGMINGIMTLSGAWHKLRTDPILKFLIVSLSFYGMSTFEGPMMSIKTINALSHYTDWTIGHVHSGALGWVAMVSVGSLYMLIPRLFGQTQMWSTKLIDVHFWTTTIGIVLYTVSMWIAGVMQGLMWRATNPDGTLTYTFVEALNATYPYYGIRLLGGLLVLFGMFLMVYNVAKTIGQGKVTPVAIPNPEPAHA